MTPGPHPFPFGCERDHHGIAVPGLDWRNADPPRPAGRFCATLARALGICGFLACRVTEPIGLPPADGPLPTDTDYQLEVVAQVPGSGVGKIPVMLVNSGPVELGYNLCFDGHPERYTRAGWVAAAVDPTPCPTIGFGLAPGDTARDEVRLRPGFAVGDYRVRVELRPLRGGDVVVRRSNVIAVR